MAESWESLQQALKSLQAQLTRAGRLLQMMQEQRSGFPDVKVPAELRLQIEEQEREVARLRAEIARVERELQTFGQESREEVVASGTGAAQASESLGTAAPVAEAVPLPEPVVAELVLEFPAANEVIAKFDGEASSAGTFASPLTPQDQEDIRWYLETYGARYTSEVDDARATQIQENLATWGAALFEAAFSGRGALRLLERFQDAEGVQTRLMTVATGSSEILALPWELLRDPESAYLLLENPRVSVRRRLLGAGGGRKAFRVKKKETLRLLYVTCRPEDASFIDPRVEALPMLDAIDAKAPGRVEVEFLRPGTFEALRERLRSRDLPQVDILHFDGHGTFGEVPSGASGSEVAQTRRVAEEQGYLLFETADVARPQNDLRSAEEVGELLHRQKVGLVVLSACQSAQVGEDPMGSVAARLTHAGIPAVVAMTHSVLVLTAQKLFGRFYGNLAAGFSVGAALDEARERLYFQKGRGLRPRMGGAIEIELEDWFLPALYAAGTSDPVLLQRQEVAETGAERQRVGNLPAQQEVGFFGRARELWEIERAFAVQGTKRLTLSGFGGQGKTYLAAEAADWLCRTGLFETACFVDYASFQGSDAVGLAVATLNAVLQEGATDAEEIAAVLRQKAVLVVLDNLEAIEAAALQELLGAAVQWSEAGRSRVLLTTRQDALRVPGYEKEGSFKHQQLDLRGLSPADALKLFERVLELPPVAEVELPEEGALKKLFEMVGYHPLSIRLLARELKVRRIADVGVGLARLLQETEETDKDRSLVASLRLSLERLEPELREWLPQLGIFAGGAWEPLVTQVTELQEEQWQRLREALQGVGLVQAEVMPGVTVPFWRFHPTLGPVLWQEVPEEAREALRGAHRQAYYGLVSYLYQADTQTPVQARQIARRELPNLLQAAYGALAAGEEYAVDFADSVNRFLDNFGMGKEQERLTARAQAAAGEVGSQGWFVARSTLGEQLYGAGRLAEALQVFEDVLAGLGEAPTYNRCLTLARIGRCLKHQGQAAGAVERLREALAVAGQLEQTDGVKKQASAVQTDLADVLRDMGQFAEARATYEASLASARELGHDRGEAVTEIQMGTLELRQGNLAEAARRYQEALQKFQQLQEPATEAVVWHQLGMTYQEAQQWEAAEGAYREAARLHESQGSLVRAAETWCNLAVVNKGAGKLQASEAWYRKAIAGAKAAGDRLQESRSLNNLANLLQQQGDKLEEAQQLAEEALAIKQTLDPAAAQIWTTYNILANIADKQNDPTQAQAYRRQAREAKAAYAGTQYELERWQGFIAGVVAATQDAEVRQQIEEELADLVRRKYVDLAEAVRMIWAGARDVDAVCARLNLSESMVAMAILRELA